MATKKRATKRLALPTTPGDLAGILLSSTDRIQEKPRSGGEWKRKLDQVFNLEKFNYRLGPEPVARFAYGRKAVVFTSKEGRNREFDPRVAMVGFKLAHRAMRSKKSQYWGYIGRSLEARGKSEIKVGCQTFDWPQILAFGKEQGWDKDNKKAVKKGKKK